MQAFAVPRTAGPAFSEQELAYYGQLFAQVDVNGRGCIGGLQAAGFLSASGIHRKVLKKIWDISDTSTRGELGPEEFSIALRLVAHAQAGHEVTPDLVFQAPAAPPFFGASPPHAACGGSRGRSPAPEGRERQLPSSRDLRKYGRLFHRRVLQRGEGLLAAADAKELFERSGVPGTALQQVWFLADHDGDGQLSWSEFVLAMHLIRLVRLGQPLPQPPAGLSLELTDFLGSLEPAEVYARQPSRSPRSLSAATSVSFGSESSSPLRRPEPEQATPVDFGVPCFGSQEPEAPPSRKRGGRSRGSRGVEASAKGAADGNSGGGGQPSAMGAGAADAALGADRFALDEGAPAFGKTQRLPSHGADTLGEKEAGSFGGFAGGSNLGSLASPTSRSRPSRMPWRRESSPDERHPEDRHSPEFGSRRKHDGLPQPQHGCGARPVEHLEVLIEAEKKLVQRLRLDVDELDEELQRLEMACREEERESSRERAECDRINGERQHLLQQLEASQRQHAELKLEHKGLHIESVLLRRDTDHYSKEAAFLQRLLDEGVRDAQVLEQSIEYLEQSNQSLLAHTKALEEARREVLEHVQLEKDLLRQEEREAILAKSALETLRTGGAPEAAARLVGSRPATDALCEGGGLQQPRRTRGSPAREDAVAAYPGCGLTPLAEHGGGLFGDLGTAAPLPGAKEPPPGALARPLVRVPMSLLSREGV